MAAMAPKISATGLWRPLAPLSDGAEVEAAVADVRDAERLRVDEALSDADADADAADALADSEAAEAEADALSEAADAEAETDAAVAEADALATPEPPAMANCPE